MHVRQVDFTFGLGAGQDQVHQRVVRQIQQARERVDFLVAQAFLVRIKEARENDVIFEQAAATAPAQPGSVGRIGLMRSHNEPVIRSTLYTACDC
jgi:hypothetical protein